MLNYRINTKKFNRTRIKLICENISFIDFETLVDDSILTSGYDGNKLGKIMATCECSDIDKISNGGTVSVENTLYLNYNDDNNNYQEVFTLNEEYEVIGVNNGNKSFSFYYDKYIPLEIERITSGENNEDKIILYFNDIHFFDATDQEITLRFKYRTNETPNVEKDMIFTYLSPKTLVIPYEDFDDEIYVLLFNSDKEIDSEVNQLKYVNKFNSEDKITEEQYQELEEDKKTFYVIVDTTRIASFGYIEIFRENFIFTEKTNYTFEYERPIVDLNIPIVNTFETTLCQMELLNEHFVEYEKKNAINRITDIEKDIYYPSISNAQQNKFVDVYTIKFNLHFREHRDNDWLVENKSLWNCVEQDFDGDGNPIDGTARFVSTSRQMTTENRSDLLSFLGFTNNDVHYQKNKLKKSFLRLLYFDSTNSANQNLIGYSTIFFNTGNLFTKYTKYIEQGDYIAIGANVNNFGIYSPTEGKRGIRVDRDYFNSNSENDEETRLDSQFIVKSKNMSKSSSEGFYIYIWKDNEMSLPQDLYMKVEFNHAGYGRTIPFMMPYWDKNKWNNIIGIKTFQEILDDWNSKAENTLDQHNRVVWKNNGRNTDGHYGIKQFVKYSYIHLKYKYDKEHNKHLYYLDPDTYGDSVTNQDINEIVINLYEAKVE